MIETVQSFILPWHCIVLAAGWFSDVCFCKLLVRQGNHFNSMSHNSITAMLKGPGAHCRITTPDNCSSRRAPPRHQGGHASKLNVPHRRLKQCKVLMAARYIMFSGQLPTPELSKRESQMQKVAACHKRSFWDKRPCQSAPSLSSQYALCCCCDFCTPCCCSAIAI